MMKKIVVLIAAIGLSLALVACGSTNKEEIPMPQNPTPEENNTEDTGGPNVNEHESDQNSSETGQNSDVVNQEDMQKQMDDLDYAEFNLEVEYADHTEYEVELEKNSNNSVEAEIKDSINNVKLKGAEAFNELHPLVQELTINQQTAKDEAISETLKVFNLDGAYSKFELEITFKDGTKIEFEDRK